MNSAVSAARSVWTIPGKITFSSLQSPSAKIVWFNDPFASAPTDFAYTQSYPEGNRGTYFSFYLNTDETWGYANASHRHHLQNTAAHELGHAFNLGHNGSLKSLMYFDIFNYFVNGIQSPQACDLVYVNGTYPQ
jgi:hypothetical protein